MRRIPLFIFLTLAAAPLYVRSEELPRGLQNIPNLKLGDSWGDVETAYPPKWRWERYRDREFRGNLIRVLLNRDRARHFPSEAEQIRLGFRGNRLAHVQLIYTPEQSRQKPLGELVGDLSLIYGEPRRVMNEEIYFWWDADTAIVVSDAMMAVSDGRATELRASLEIMDKDIFEPLQ